jgi:hypothetical protein
MSDSTNPINQLAVGQANLPTRINELFDAASPSTIYGRRASTSTGLTWGYYGGRWSGFSIANDTVTLGASTTTYLVVERATGALSAATATTNWDNAADYARAYKIVTGSATVTSYEDHRAGDDGTLGSGGGGGGGMTNPMTDVGDLIRGGTAGAPTRVAAGTNGHILTLVGGMPAWAPNAGAGSPVVAIPIACSDETTALTTGSAKVTFRMPHGFTLSEVRASLTTASTGADLVVDINEGGTSILSTKLSIDAGEKTSTTAATPAVISDPNLGDDGEITIDIDQVGSTVAGAGLKVYLIGVVA